MRNRTILITGGSGFIGTKLAEKLVSDNQVIVLDIIKGDVDKVDYLTAPYNDLDTLNTILPYVDIVFHLAWSSTPAMSLTEVEEYQQNIKPSQDLITLSRKHKVKHFIFMSSAGAIYGPIKTPFKESDTPRPINSYGKAKLEVEKILQDQSDHNFKATCIRATNVVGDSQTYKNKQGVIPAIKNALENDQVFEMWGNSQKDYLHVSDLILGLLSTSKQANSFEIFNLGSGKLLSVANIISQLEKRHHKKLKIIKKPAKKHDIQTLFVDTTKAKKILSWKPISTNQVVC